jgi:hypothetical protein
MVPFGRLFSCVIPALGAEINALDAAGCEGADGIWVWRGVQA